MPRHFLDFQLLRRYTHHRVPGSKDVKVYQPSGVQPLQVLWAGFPPRLANWKIVAANIINPVLHAKGATLIFPGI